ncbi:MAG: gliding motility-associated C-terminal domain-containing protein [Taibaiella sp.]|nr:gliding motility-associated C-terminal domain-containing protein [Taibaiella sp.]
MNRKLRLLLSVLGLACLTPKADAQLGSPLFSLKHDTICKESEFVPDSIVSNAQTYRWSFCTPLLGAIPQSNSLGTGTLQLNTNNNLTTVRSGDFFYSFTANSDGRVFRYQYEDGIEVHPIVTDFGHFQFSTPSTPSGTSVIETADGWHVFVIGRSTNGARLVRLDFGNGLNYPMTGYHTYNVLTTLTDPREIYTVVANDSVRAFTFDNNEMKRIDFGANLDTVANITNFGTMGGVFDGVSGISAVREMDNFHFMVTNENSHKLTHITFGNSYLNLPFAIDLGSLSGDIDAPTGIAIVRSCNDYYGYVTNKDNAEWVVLHWPASIAGTPTATVYDLGANLLLPTALSNAVRENGAVYMHVVNSNNALTVIKYDNCTNASVGGSNLRVPPAVKYDQVGTYSVSLIVDEGLATERNYCLPIHIVEYPSINLTTQDTLICSGDTINMHALTFGTDSIVWSPDYNINTTKGNFVKVWPEYSQVYTVTFNFAENCIVKKEFDIKVDKVVADAGIDRTITDGSTTIIGGPNTTLRDDFTYQWTPNLFFESNPDTTIAWVRPAQNMTYYLTVTAPSGCRSIDSVLVRVPCEDVRLPNAFVASTQTFGLLNLQLTQVNYFRIYDRWGQEVFSTTNPNTHWNGRNKKGIECALGVYVWEIDAYCKDTNQRFRTTGNVTLLR